MAEFYMRWPGGRTKAATFSYDDGVETDVELMKILRDNGLCGTFNINSGLFAPQGTVYPPDAIHRRMTRDAVLAAYEGADMEVAIHGLTHPFLESVPRDRMVYEILRDRENLEQMFGRIIRGCALPYGTCDDAVTEALRVCGLVYCRYANHSGQSTLPSDWMALVPTAHHSDPALPGIIERFLAAPDNRPPQLLYVWGHSYEFLFDKGNNTWAAFRRICETVGGRDDVWYATNIDIVDYERAYRALRVSLDGRLVENPSAVPVWVFAFGRTVEIGPGETKTI